MVATSPGKRSGLLFVVSAPAGTGKTTLIEMLTAECSSIIKSISYTTRSPRQGEVDGVDYHFIDENEFAARADAGEFLESVQLYGYSYGTSRCAVEKLLREGKHVVLVIDTQGAMHLKDKCEAIYIFIAPPSMGELTRRLKKRNSENAQAVALRLSIAEGEMAALNVYDYLIINDSLATAYQALKSIVIAEEHRISH